MRARDQCTIFSIGGKFCPDYRLLLELHALTLVDRSYALLLVYERYMKLRSHDDKALQTVSLSIKIVQYMFLLGRA